MKQPRATAPTVPTRLPSNERTGAPMTGTARRVRPECSSVSRRASVVVAAVVIVVVVAAAWSAVAIATSSLLPGRAISTRPLPRARVVVLVVLVFECAAVRTVAAGVLHLDRRLRGRGLGSRPWLRRLRRGCAIGFGRCLRRRRPGAACLRGGDAVAAGELDSLVAFEGWKFDTPVLAVVVVLDVRALPGIDHLAAPAAASALGGRRAETAVGHVVRL